MAERIRRKDWSQTPLGPLSEWSEALKTSVAMVLDIAFPSILYWGPEMIAIHNDAYLPILGQRADDALGQSLPDVWSEAIGTLLPVVQRAYAGEALSFRSTSFMLQRHGHSEQSWFDWSFSPIRGVGGEVDGVLNLTIEKTAEVMADRRRSILLTLSDTLRQATSQTCVAPLVARLLGEFLQADVVGYAEIDPSQHLTSGEWHRQDAAAPQIDLGDELWHSLCERRGLQVEDLNTSRQTNGPFGPYSALTSPVMIRNRLAGFVFIYDAPARRWKDEEVDLIREVANRTWAAGEARRTAEALARSEQQFRNLADAMPQLVWTATPNGKVDYYNSRAQDFDGLERKGDGSWSWVPALHPNDQTPTFAAWKSAWQNKSTYQIEHRLRMKDGSYRWFLSRAIAFRHNESVVKWYGTATDIDDTKESEARFRAMADGLPLIVWVHDPEGKQEFVNQTFYQFFGVTREQIKKNGWQIVMHPDDAEEYSRRFLDSNQNQRPFHSEVRVQDADKRWRRLESWGRPRFSTSGTYLGMVGTSLDITDRARAEANLRQSEQNLRTLSETLEQRVLERTAELQEKTARLRILANELASAEHRERKRLAALLHDDLQQLLVAAKMQTGIMAQHAADEKGKKAAEHANRWIGEAAEAARDLTRELRPPILYEGGLIPALHWLASEMEERHHLKITIRTQQLTQPLSDDIKALIFECIRELLFNVTKYADTEHATIILREEDGMLDVVVSDQGAGFDVAAAAYPRQTDGFGLFSIRERIAALEGTMNLESSPGHGTKITLMIPIPEDSVVSPPNAPSSRSQTATETARAATHDDRRTRVLVVDDHTMVREGLANMINSDERLVVVAEAADGLKAILAVEEHAPDVILMDLNMPRMNGIEATREIRRRWPLVAIVGLSVQSDSATAKSMIDAGAARFLSKAGDTEQMIATICELAQSQSPPPVATGPDR